MQEHYAMKQINNYFRLKIQLAQKKKKVLQN